ncbi:CHAT domain-containing protein [Rhodobacteraceae bacterium CCMM004]|nr:CHAT domain-containing protein [Rhodobacteraceae bacterium CCMM004]
MSKILVPGEVYRGSNKSGAESRSPRDQPFLTVRVRTGRDTATKLHKVDLPDEHVVEVTLEDGIVLYMRADQLLSNSEARGTEGDVLPMALSFNTRERGAGRYLVSLYRFFKGEGVKEAAVETAAERLEGKLKVPDTLVRCETPRNLSEAGPLVEGQKMLLLLHGTFSSTEGSFGHLSSTAAGHMSDPWRVLQAGFQVDRKPAIFGFEHRSLTKSPLSNAIDLVDQLPRGAQLTLLSHSRGGLVGELLARANRAGATAAGQYFDDVDRDIFESRYVGDVLEATLEQLIELDAKSAEKRLKIDRFVRVACPIRGTLLASKRLDRYLSIIFNVLSFAPGPQQPFVEPFAAFVRAIVGSKANPAMLPGLEAMMPTSPLIAALNRNDITLSSALEIVAGDTGTGGILRSLAVFASDLFYREDHDFVVNTAAMFGGAPRSREPRALVDAGRDVSHFNYFRNPDTVARITDALVGKLPPEPVDRPAAPETMRGLNPVERPQAILLPGIMGSTLSLGSDRVWIDPIDLVRGKLTDICVGADGRPVEEVRVDGYVQRYYRYLAKHIARTHTSSVLAYDWRISIDVAADQLKLTVERALDATEQSRQPVRLLCHSMGGLVARRMIAKHRDVWERMLGRPGSRVVMLGTPNGGSAAIAAALIGRDAMVRRLALVDIKNDLSEILAAIAPLPGILELLPTDEDHRYFKADTWTRLRQVTSDDKWTTPPQSGLDAASAFWRGMELDQQDLGHITYIAGQASSTVIGFRMEPFAVLATPAGDGRVPWSTGILPGVDTWYAAGIQHGDLPRDRSLFDAITDLMTRGATERLPKTPPSLRGAASTFELIEEPVIYPAGGDFELLAMGGEPEAEIVKRTETRRAKVTIEHGDLRLQRGTVVVGHYRGAQLLSAEEALNATLGGTLALHRGAGIYPEEIGSSEFFVDEDLDRIGPEAALVVGLGQFGELTPRGLRTTLTRAFTRYALRFSSDMQPWRRLTTLLIGHRDNMIGLGDSVRAILDALEGANRIVPKRLRIEEVRVLELFEDRATTASEAMSEFAAGERYGSLAIDPKLRRGRAGWLRSKDGLDLGWQLIVRITRKSDDANLLRFQVMNGSAMVDADSVEIDRRAMDHLIHGVQTTRSVDDETGRLLFIRMIPKSVRQRFSEGANITLIVDEVSAGYPWELMVDQPDGRPLAVRAGMIRQIVQEKTDIERSKPPAQDVALVIGNPKSYYSDLPGALDEAKVVAEAMRQSGIAELEVVFGDEGNAEQRIFLTEARFFHFAGHGVFDGGPDRNIIGLVIGRDGFLTGNDIDQLETVPEFIFLNCCHIGRISPEALDDNGLPTRDPELWKDRSQLAANIALAFIRRGTKAVIAAGWAIDDGQAKLFSEVFYRTFLRGATVSQAIGEARRATYDQNPREPTWGAYQCYGDPDYRFTSLGGTPPRSPRETSYIARNRVLADLHEIRAGSRFVSDQATAQTLLDRLKCIAKAVEKNARWSTDAQVLQALGWANAEIGYRDKAIEFLTEATKASPAALSIESIELLSTLRVRAASEKRWSAKSHELYEALSAERKAHEQAVKTLLYYHEQVVPRQKDRDLAPGSADDTEENEKLPSGSTDRLLRLGDTYLRWASAIAYETRKYAEYRALLRKSIEAYTHAEIQISGEDPLDLAYARLRKSASRLFLDWEMGAPGLDLLAVVDSVNASLKLEEDARPIFERELRLAETRLLQHLLDAGEDVPHSEDLILAFVRAFHAGATIGQRQETISDLEALSRLLERRTSPNDEKAQSVRTIARELRQRALMLGNNSEENSK